MQISPEFILRFAKTTKANEEPLGMMYIIIQRPYSHYEKELRHAFKGKKDIKVILDKRYSERRAQTEPFPKERRRADRRIPKQELVQVVISAA